MLKYEELINELKLIHSSTKDQTTRTRIYSLLARVMDGIELTNVQQQAIYRKIQHSYYEDDIRQCLKDYFEYSDEKIDSVSSEWLSLAVSYYEDYLDNDSSWSENARDAIHSTLQEFNDKLSK